jgi:hypothetical protein
MNWIVTSTCIISSSHLTLVLIKLVDPGFNGSPNSTVTIAARPPLVSVGLFHASGQHATTAAQNATKRNSSTLKPSACGKRWRRSLSEVYVRRANPVNFQRCVWTAHVELQAARVCGTKHLYSRLHWHMDLLVWWQKEKLLQRSRKSRELREASDVIGRNAGKAERRGRPTRFVGGRVPPQNRGCCGGDAAKASRIPEQLQSNIRPRTATTPTPDITIEILSTTTSSLLLSYSTHSTAAHPSVAFIFVPCYILSNHSQSLLQPLLLKTTKLRCRTARLQQWNHS